MDANRDIMVMAQLDGVQGEVVASWRGSNASEVAQLAW